MFFGPDDEARADQGLPDLGVSIEGNCEARRVVDEFGLVPRRFGGDCSG